MHNSQKPIKNGVNLKIKKDTNSNVSQRNLIQSGSNNVFSQTLKMSTLFFKKSHTNLNEIFLLTQVTLKRKQLKKINLTQPKKNVETKNTETEQKIKPPPLIFISEILDFSAFRSRLIEFICVVISL